MELGIILALVAFLFGLPGNIKSVLELIQIRREQSLGKNSERVRNDDAKNLLESFRKQSKVRNEKELIEILSNNLYISDKGYARTGIVSNVGCSIFLDVFSPTTVLANRNLMASIMAEKVLDLESKEGKAFEAIAVPKMGNVLLADRVAQLLGKQLIVVRTKDAIRFGYPFEGYPKSGQNCILIDDISSDGSFLADCIKKLRLYGLKIQHCLCLYQRTDGNASAELSSKRVTLHYFYSLNDDELNKYINKND